ncbi:sce7726 family protein [Chitinophaga sp.]|uniref:sce7726 family protein n=1 Tax=Chitinophaga sp. TaxID=1869181 RepID=UPI002F93BD0F
MKDPCIRKLLRTTQLSHFLEDPNSKVVEEFTLPVAKARIDVAVINGSIHGYEIKSASDTLQRLPSQIEAYTKVFDYLSVVTENKYYEKIVACVPSWVGIIVCDDKNGIKSIKQLRKPRLNKRTEGFFIAKLLWRDELIDSLIEHKIPFRKKDRNWLLCEALSSHLDSNAISFIVREKLKTRGDWKN